MKIIDEKGRLFEKINILDLIIVITLLILVGFTFIKFDKNNSKLFSDTIIEYTVSVENIRQSTVDALSKNKENIMDYTSKKEIGNIVDFNYSPAVKLEQMADGRYKEVMPKDKYDCLLTIRVKGTISSDNYFTSSGKKIITGDTIEVFNKYASTSGTIKSVKVIE